MLKFCIHDTCGKGRKIQTYHTNAKFYYSGKKRYTFGKIQR